MSTETDALEQALDALLTAMLDDRATRAPTNLTAFPMRLTALSGSLPTRSEMEIAQLLRQPVYSALRIGVRRLGLEAFKVTGSTDGMRAVADRVADQAPSHVGRRLAMMDSAWDGIGTDADRWWA